MTEKITLNSWRPESIGRFELDNKEYCQYLYLPVMMAGSLAVALEPRLEFLTTLIAAAINREIQEINKKYSPEVSVRGLKWLLSQPNAMLDKYIYLTVKQNFVPKGLDQNRPGWHSDGFGTNDVQYIWFDKWPTEFLIGSIPVRNNDKDSMLDMEVFAHKYPNYYSPKPFNLYRIDQNNIHRTVPAPEDGVRLFVKITISDHIYAQQGNSHNYLLDYDWKLSERKLERNQPHESNT